MKVCNFFRPWSAKVTCVDNVGQEMEVQWFERDNQKKTPRRDGKVDFILTDNKDLLSTECIMHWIVDCDETPTGLVFTATSLAYFEQLYHEHDICYL